MLKENLKDFIRAVREEKVFVASVLLGACLFSAVSFINTDASSEVTANVNEAEVFSDDARNLLSIGVIPSTDELLAYELDSIQIQANNTILVSQGYSDLEDIATSSAENYENYLAEKQAEADDLARRTKYVTFFVTAYCSCQKCCGKYALNRPIDENGEVIVRGDSGARLRPSHSVAVDPDVIPYGSKIYLYGQEYVAEDCGGAIDGYDIDVYFTDHQEALNWAYKYGGYVEGYYILEE